MPILRITLGASSAGKSYYAKQLLAKDKSWKCVERDKIREMVSAGNTIWRQGDKIEQLVTDTQAFVAENLIKQGFNVLVSDTNLAPRTQKFWSDFAARMNVKFEVEDSFLSVPLNTLITRDLYRENSVGAEVILKQFNKYIKPLNIAFRQEKEFLPKQYVQDYTKPICVISDLDNSLALFNRYDKTSASFRSPYNASTCGNDELNVPLKKVLDLYAQNQYTVILMSGREEKYRSQTEAWLAKHTIKYHALYMRKTGDFRKDYLIKGEIVENEVLPNYQIEVIYDDRRQNIVHFRQSGICCFVVNEGNF